jgi:hypothetical protein
VESVIEDTFAGKERREEWWGVRVGFLLLRGGV